MKAWFFFPFSKLVVYTNVDVLYIFNYLDFSSYLCAFWGWKQNREQACLFPAWQEYPEESWFWGTPSPSPKVRKDADKCLRGFLDVSKQWDSPSPYCCPSSHPFSSLFSLNSFVAHFVFHLMHAEFCYRYIGMPTYMYTITWYLQLHKHIHIYVYERVLWMVCIKVGPDDLRGLFQL